MEANNLMKDLEPTTPQEYILKGVVNAALGQEQGIVSLHTAPLSRFKSGYYLSIQQPSKNVFMYFVYQNSIE